MDIDKINIVLVNAIAGLQDGEIEGLSTMGESEAGFTLKDLAKKVGKYVDKAYVFGDRVVVENNKSVVSFELKDGGKAIEMFSGKSGKSVIKTDYGTAKKVSKPGDLKSTADSFYVVLKDYFDDEW